LIARKPVGFIQNFVPLFRKLTILRPGLPFFE
jgi:hypothetical protein